MAGCSMNRSANISKADAAYSAEFNEGVSAFRKGDYEKSYRVFSKIINTKIDTPEHASVVYRLEKINANLGHIKGTDYESLEAAIEGKVSDEEKFAIQDSVRILQSLKALQNQTAALERAARKIFEIATAKQALERIEQENKVTLTGGEKSIIWATTHLFEAIAASASPEEQHKLSEMAGGMSEEELKAAQERLRNTNIS